MSLAGEHGSASTGGNRRWTLPARGLVGPLLVVAAWQLIALLLAGRYLIAGPIDVLQHFAANAGLLLGALGVTLEAAALGFVYGNVAAIGLAALASLFAPARRLVGLVALVFFCLPFVATGPILRVVFGPGIGPQVTLAALAVYYPTYLVLMVGLRAAPAGWFDMVRSYGRGAWTQFRVVRARAALPYLFAGLQIAAPAAFLGAMVGEFTGAERGLGVLAIRAMRALDVTATWTVAALAALVSIAAYVMLGRLRGALAEDSPSILLAPASEPSGGRGSLPTLLAAPVFAILAVVVVLAIWQGLIALLALSPFFAKGPADVWSFLFLEPAADLNRSQLFAALFETLVLAVPGYVGGLLLGASLAILVTVAAGAAGIVLPLAIALRSIPIVTTAPLVVLALGRGPAGTMTVVALMIFFPTLVACLEGLRRAPRAVLDMFDTYAAGSMQRLFLARVPAMLPAFFAAARLSVPAAILAATTAEWLATGRGIGGLMAISASTSAYGMLWASIVAVTIVATLAYVGIEAVERRVLAIYAVEQLRN